MVGKLNLCQWRNGLYVSGEMDKEWQRNSGLYQTPTGLT